MNNAFLTKAQDKTLVLKIWEIIEQIRYYQDLYNMASPCISDAFFDELLQVYHKDWLQLSCHDARLLEENCNFLPHINIMDFNLNRGGQTVLAHSVPMLSLNNIFNMEGLRDFIKRSHNFVKDAEVWPLMVEPKIDGFSLALYYQACLKEHGVLQLTLIKALTRGNGFMGEDVTHRVRFMENVTPQPVQLKECYINMFKEKFNVLEIRGEGFMEKKAFEELQNNSGGGFASARNAAVGTLKHLNLELSCKRKLKFLPYAMVLNREELRRALNTQQEIMQFIASLGFQTPTHALVNSMEQFEDFKSAWPEAKNLLPYQTDGLVLKINNLNLQERMGFLAKVPRFATAFKFNAPYHVSKLLKVITQVGRTGVVTPVALIEPILIEGVRVSKASLHNAKEIICLNLNVGDMVKIVRSGEVIPYILGVEKKINPQAVRDFVEDLFANCPSCYAPLQKQEIFYKCLNWQNCQGQILARLEHFVSKMAFNIKGVGPEQLKLFMNNFGVRDWCHIFELHIYRKELLNLHGMGEVLVNKLLGAIEFSKNISMDRFIFALGINLVGKQNADIIANFYGNMQSFLEDAVDLQKLQNNLGNNLGIGPRVLIEINNFVTQRYQEISKLVQLVNISHASIQADMPSMTNNTFNNKNFLITGVFEGISRQELSYKIKSRGGKVLSVFSKNMDFLICGARPGSKLQRVESFIAEGGRVKIIEEAALIDFFD